MGLRFFADHCVSNAIMHTLRAAGHEVMRLREQLPVESLDAVVITKAQQLDAILLSLNGDFADIVTYPPADYQGIIALQVRNHPEITPQLMQRLQDYWTLASFAVLRRLTQKALQYWEIVTQLGRLLTGRLQ